VPQEEHRLTRRPLSIWTRKARFFLGLSLAVFCCVVGQPINRRTPKRSIPGILSSG
jgi:hypothetical protein